VVELGGRIVDQDLRKAPLTEAVIEDTDFLRCRLDGRLSLRRRPPALFGAVLQRGSVVECGVRGADLRQAVREHADRGVDVIKIMASGGNLTPGSRPEVPQYGPAELRAAVVRVRAGRILEEALDA